jgi:hypothetical protein
MPPVEQSLRGSLLKGASTLALSITGYSAQAQGVQPIYSASHWTVWIEGVSFQTAGGGVNVPSLPGLTTPFTTINPRGGWEGAGGFDYAWSGGWHFVFDIRYGKSRTAYAGQSGSSFISSIKTFFSSHNAQTMSERESHFVTDFMIGRDLALGGSEIQFGVRVADLTATVFAQQFKKSHFSSYFGFASTAEAASATFNNRFFGAGPRLAFTGGVPIWGPVSFDYQAGIAALFGQRSLDYTVSVAPGGIFSGSYKDTIMVPNPDGWIGLSYAFTSNVKLTGGIRADLYINALSTYAINGGGLVDVDRLYWGPFLRLTGKF